MVERHPSAPPRRSTRPAGSRSPTAASSRPPARGRSARASSEPQRAERLGRDAGLVGHQQQQVAGRGLERRRRSRPDLAVATGTSPPASARPAALLDVCPHEAARALALRELDQAVELRARQLVRAGVDARAPRRRRSSTPRKTLNSVSRSASPRSRISRPKRRSGRSRAEARDRLVVGHARERRLRAATPPAANAAASTPSVTLDHVLLGRRTTSPGRAG